MEGDPPMTGQPGLDRWGLVGGHVVEHHVEVALRVGAGYVAQERREVGACVAFAGLVGHVPGPDVEGCEQAGGPGALVVVGVPLDLAGRSGSIGAERSRAWIWVFSSRLSTMARPGGSRYRPTTSRILATRSGLLLNVNVSFC